MAEWALSTGNISYAISSVVAGQRWSALDYRFPKPFLNLYQKYSSYTNVPISFLYGISRQESMLNPDIKCYFGFLYTQQINNSLADLSNNEKFFDCLKITSITIVVLVGVFILLYKKNNKQE